MAQAFAGKGLTPPWSLAAPSCVYPADVAANCAALAGCFPEIALALFETEACLAYGEAELPPGLARLPLRWHVHLPLDLPWERGPEAVARVVLALAKKVAGLGPWAYVLHPPPEGPKGPGDLRVLAGLLADQGLAPEAVLVENVAGRDLADMWPVICDLGLGACLDLGHLLERGQEDFLGLPGLWERTRMLHLNAPDPASPGRHASLSTLDRAGRALLGRLLQDFRSPGAVVLELFSPGELFDSLRFLPGFLAGREEEAL